MKTEHDVIQPVMTALAGEPGMTLPTGTLRRKVKATLPLDHEVLNRPDTRIDQTIRNLKSHKNTPGNPFFDGYIEDVPRGFKLTAKGLKAVRQHLRKGLR